MTIRRSGLAGFKEIELGAAVHMAPDNIHPGGVPSNLAVTQGSLTAVLPTVQSLMMSRANEAIRQGQRDERTIEIDQGLAPDDRLETADQGLRFG